MRRAEPALTQEFQRQAYFARIPAGRDIFVAGDEAGAIALLLSGAVRVYKIGESGLRIIAGIALILWGLLGLGATAGVIVAVVGAVPLLAGLFDVCIFAPLFGNPFHGAEVRAGK